MEPPRNLQLDEINFYLAPDLQCSLKPNRDYTSYGISLVSSYYSHRLVNNNNILGSAESAYLENKTLNQISGSFQGHEAIQSITPVGKVRLEG